MAAYFRSEPRSGPFAGGVVGVTDADRGLVLARARGADAGRQLLVREFCHLGILNRPACQRQPVSSMNFLSLLIDTDAR